MIVKPYFFGIWGMILVISSCNAQKPTSNHSTFPPNEEFKNGMDSDNGVSLDYLMGKFNPETHPEFTEIPSKYRDNEVRYIRQDVLEAFVKMYDAASKDGVTLQIRSATRNFENQKRIWENKWTGKTILEYNLNAATDIKTDIARAKKILEYSSMPGTSRHHWGTDMDINAFENSWFDSGEGLKLYQWMTAHASAYGFCQPYTPYGKERPAGYKEEKWHWTFIPISKKLTKLAQSSLTNDMISGFLGSETATTIDIVKNYVLGINPGCRPPDL